MVSPSKINNEIIFLNQSHKIKEELTYLKNGNMSNNQHLIKKSMLYFTQFNETSFEKNITRYFQIFQLFHENDLEEYLPQVVGGLNLTLLTLTVNQPDQALDCLYSATQAPNLPLVNMLLLLLNRPEIQLPSESYTRLFSYFLDVCKSSNKELIHYYYPFFQAHMSVYLSRMGKDLDAPEKMASLVNGALTAQIFELLIDGLDALYVNFNESPTEGGVYQRFFRAFPRNQVELLFQSVREALVWNFYSLEHPRAHKIFGVPRFLAFLCYCSQMNEKHFQRQISLCEVNEQEQFLGTLLQSTLLIHTELLTKHVFSLIEHYKYTDTSKNRGVISSLFAMACHPQNINPFLISELLKIIKFDFQAYVSPLSNIREITDVLTWSIEQKHFVIAGLCLEQIEKLKMESQIPIQINFTALMSHVSSEIAPYEEVIVSSSKENPDQVLFISKAVLIARAPDLTLTGNVLKLDISFQTLKDALHYILQPKPLTERPLQNTYELFQAGILMGCPALQNACIQLVINKSFSFKELSMLVKMFIASPNEMKDALKETILLHFFRYGVSHEKEVRKKARKMQKKNEGCFKKLDVNLLLQSSQDQFLGSKDIHILASFAPDVIELDISQVMPREHVLKWIITSWKDLKKLSIPCHYESIHSVLPELKNLSKLIHLKLVKPCKESLQAISNLNLEALELVDIQEPDLVFRELLVHPPTWLKTLRTFKLTQKASFPSQAAIALIAQMQNAFSITLENVRLTNTSLAKIGALPYLYALHLKFEAKNLIQPSVDGFRQLFSEKTGFDEVGITMKNVENNPLNALYGLELKKLHLSLELENPFIAQLVDEHPDLEVLNLMDNPIDGMCIRSLVYLKKLHTLNIAKTNFSTEDIMQLVTLMPKLKTLVISPTQDHHLLSFLANSHIQLVIL